MEWDKNDDDWWYEPLPFSSNSSYEWNKSDTNNTWEHITEYGRRNVEYEYKYGKLTFNGMLEMIQCIIDIGSVRELIDLWKEDR
jgi:hypothetical protein